MASYHYPEHAPQEDTPDALSEQGFYEDEHYLDEVREPARATRVGPLGGISRLYGNYWQRQGQASGSELFWGLAYVILGTVLLYGTSIVINGQIQERDASGLLRTLYMLGIIVNTLWVIVNIAPVASLIARYRNRSQV